MPDLTPVFKWPVPRLSEVVRASDLLDFSAKVETDLRLARLSRDSATIMPAAAVNGTGLSVGTAFTTHTFNNEMYDLDDMVNLAVNNDRIWFRRAGLVSVVADPGNAFITGYQECKVVVSGQDRLRRKVSPAQNRQAIVRGLVKVQPGQFMQMQTRMGAAASSAAYNLAVSYVAYCGPQLLANTSFEADVLPWAPTGSLTFGRLTNPVRRGQFCAYYTALAATVSLGSEFVPCVAGQPLTLTAWVNPSATWANNSVQIAWHNLSGVQIGTADGANTSCPANVWTPLFVQGTAPANTVNARAIVRATGTPPSTTIFRIDDVNLVRSCV